jgi:tRNA nucleotidyltransferase (CCA-adding enzyme)
LFFAKLKSIIKKSVFGSFKGVNVDKMSDFYKKVEELLPILREIINFGGKPYLVGGTVRDLVLGLDTKDIDIEVHGISLEDLQKCLSKFGYVKLVGKKFGVLRMAEYDVDWSLPRKDTKGRKPKVEIDPEMNIEMALRRRDLTMNAMAVDLSGVCSAASFDKLRMSGVLDEAMNVKSAHPELVEGCSGMRIIDPFNGLRDIKEKKLRAVDPKLFLDDPLRFFRVMQFIGRFEMLPDDELNDLCKTMDLYDVTSDSELAKERIFEEIKKLLLLSKRPSLGFRWLKDIGRLKEIFPELYDLIATEQRLDFHPEGNVFEHTMQTLDAAAALDKYKDDEEKLIIMLALLCHDLGKPGTTAPDFTCHGHDEFGVPIAKKLLKRITNDKHLIETVGKLVRYHTRPWSLLKQGASIKAYKRLALKLAPQLTLRQLAIVNLADVQGRNPEGMFPLPPESYNERFERFLNKIKEIGVESGPEEPVLLGRHLLDKVKPGPKLGELLKRAYQIQIEEGVTDLEELKKRVLEED